MAGQQWRQTTSGVKMPWIIYGTAWKKERTADLVVQAVQAGFRGIDTACQPRHYDEPLLGMALNRLKKQGFERESLFVQTKFTPISSQDPKRVPYDENLPIALQVAQSFEVSKKNLQTSYVDSLVLHSPLVPHARLMETWRAMEKIQATGGAAQLGISNCYSIDVMRQLHAEASVKPVVLQNRFYQQTGYDADLRHWCCNHGVIYQSFWTLTANRHILVSSTVQTIAQQHNKTEEQVLFRFLNQIGIVPLTGTCTERHMMEDLNVFDFELSTDELNNVAHLFNQI